MSEFQPIYPETINLDPYKRVKYSHGLVLGVDEFEQEQRYLLEKDQLHNRSLHGCGTVCGLDVTLEDTEGSWKLIIAPGLAVDPTGKDVHVTQAQCSVLNTWLFKHSEEIAIRLSSSPSSPGGVLPLYLVLCYDECETDFVPVPSGPCQTLDKTSVASRIKDNFKLSLEFEAPEQTEKEAIQNLLNILRQIEVSNAPDSLQANHIVQIVVDSISTDSPAYYSPPLPSMHMHAEDVEEFMRLAFRIWVTKVRPKLLSRGRIIACGAPLEKCLLLAQLNLEVEYLGDDLGYRMLAESTPILIEDDRPYLVQSQLLQDYLWETFSSPFETLFGSPPLVIDEINLMHLSGSETVEGNKTFTSPLALAEDGRVRKRIMLSPSSALILTPANARLEAFRAGVPGLQFLANGEVSFNISIPDDIQYNLTPELRLCWGYTAPAGTTDTISFDWQVRNRFANPGIALTSLGGGPANVISDTEIDAEQSRVYVTDYISLSDAIAENDVFGAIRILLTSLTITAGFNFYLLHVDLRYVADRIGRPL
jgi:hypothetical protein